jgi:hypothetical protein
MHIIIPQILYQQKSGSLGFSVVVVKVKRRIASTTTTLIPKETEIKVEEQPGRKSGGYLGGYAA